MKIFAITDNYNRSGEIITGEKNSIGWRFLPDSAIFRAPNPFFLDEENDLCAAFPTLALKIDRVGKSIGKRFAGRYSSHFALGINLRNLTLSDQLSEAGLPVDPAWGYDRSFLLSDWLEIPFELSSKVEIRTSSIIKTQDRERESTSIIWKAEELISDIAEVISRISERNLLRIGDIVLPGFHSDGLTLVPDSYLKATLRLSGSQDHSEINIEIPVR